MKLWKTFYDSVPKQLTHEEIIAQIKAKIQANQPVTVEEQIALQAHGESQLPDPNPALLKNIDKHKRQTFLILRAGRSTRPIPL